MNYLTNICRICIKEHSTLINIYTTEVGSMKLSGVLAILIPEIDFEEDDLPSSICVHCVTRMKDAFEFKQMCIKSNALLQSHKAQRNAQDNDPDTETAVILTNTDEVMNYQGPSLDGDMLIYEMPPSSPAADPLANPCSECGQARCDTCSRCTPSKPLQCEECSTVFCGQSDLRRHTQLHTKSRLYPCNVCGKRFTRQRVLDDHSSVHTAQMVGCDLCGRAVQTQASLKEHLLTHPDRSTGCLVCQCGQRDQEDFCELNNFLNTSAEPDERPHKCAECDRTFYSATKLEQHSRSHRPRQFQCSACPQSFGHKSGLRLHARAHLRKRGRKRDKPFKCNTCGKCYAILNSLTAHVRTHDT